MSTTRLIRTDDGSASVYAERFGASYHSTHGALQEAQHVFVAAGLAHSADHLREVSILEAGFGSGLNCLASLAYAQSLGLRLDYTGLESFPLSHSLLSAMDFERLPALQTLVGLAPKLIEAMHAAPWPSVTRLGEGSVLRKRLAAIEELTDVDAYDLVYFDAFAPKIQPELWTADVFQRYHRALRPGGVLVTYCVQGQVRRNMKAAGFEVVKLPGPPGKREMTRATKPH